MTAIEQIDAVIKERGLSRRKLAIKAGIPPSTLQSAMERNNGWNYNMLVKVAAALDMRLSDLTSLILGAPSDEQPDEPDESFLARLKNAPIVHDGMNGESEIIFHGLTAFWRDPVGLYASPACSNCGSGAAMKTRFCPHCGARMEGVT